MRRDTDETKLNRRTLLQWLAAGSAGVLTTAVSSRVFADAADEERFRGRWLVRGAGGAQSRRNASIETATDDMSIFTRGIARRRLRSGLPIHRTIDISGEGANFRAKVGGYDLNFAADGREHAFTDPFDNDMQARQQFRRGRLVQRMRSDDAVLSHTLSVADDGQSMTLTVRIESHHLPGNVSYRVDYRKG